MLLVIFTDRAKITNSVQKLCQSPFS